MATESGPVDGQPAEDIAEKKDANAVAAVAATLSDSQPDPILDSDPAEIIQKVIKGPDGRFMRNPALAPKPTQEASPVVGEVEDGDAGGEVATPPAPSIPRHDRHTVEMAHDFGLSQIEIDQLEPGELAAVVRQHQRAALSQLHQLRQAPPAAKPTPAEDEGPEINWGVDENNQPLTEAQYKALSTPFKQQAKRWAESEKRLDAQEKRLNEFFHAQTVKQTEALIENVFAQADPALKELVGDANGYDLLELSQSADPALAAEAQAAAAQLQFRLDACALAGDPSHPQFAARLRGAYRRLAGYNPAARVQAEERTPAGVNRINGHLGVKRPTPEQWRNAAMARPTHARPQKMQPGVDAAEHAVGERLRTFGINPLEGE